MSMIFMFCAVAGGTVLVCQLVLTLVGFGGHEAHGGDHGLGADHDAGGLDHDVTSADGHDAHGEHGSTWLFSVISIRTLIAATTFFGLGGLLAESMQARPPMQVLAGLLLGWSAMVAVHKLFQLMYRLGEDGTVKIQRAVGLKGTVYVPIPANKTGSGKVHVNLQNRLMEYTAVTASDEKLATGTQIVVIDIVGKDTLEVGPAGKPLETSAT